MKEWQFKKISFFIQAYTQNTIKDFFENIEECEPIDESELPKKAPYFRLQWWYNEEWNKLYIHYEVIDKGHLDDKPYIALYQEINRVILTSMRKDLWIWPEIIGPSVNHYFYETLGDSPMVDETMEITANTYTYWPLFHDEAFYFINDIQVNFPVYAPTVRRKQMEFAFRRERIDALLDLSKRYYEIWKTDPERYKREFPNYFEEYRTMYETDFHKQLYTMPEYAATHEYSGIHYLYLSMVFPPPPEPEP